MRTAEIQRDTKETQVFVAVNLDGTGKSDLASGIPFLDHMLDQIARHGAVDLTVKAKGDLEIDAHHTVEDIGITLGEAESGAAVRSSDLLCLVGEFSTIVADPPWKVNRLQNPGGGDFHPGKVLKSIKLEYPTMTVEEIAALPVKLKAAKHAHLYIWTINKYVEDTYDIARAWGFEPSTLLYWLKQPTGVVQGGAFVPCVEPILFCRRGSLKAKRRCNRNWWGWPRARHSQKPEEFQTVVESVSPGPYLEMFARRSRPNWTTWGNEA